MAVEMCLELDDSPEGAVFYILGQSQEVGVPASVLVDGEETLCLLSSGNELFGFLQSGCEGFLNDYFWRFRQSRQHEEKANTPCFPASRAVLPRLRWESGVVVITTTSSLSSLTISSTVRRILTSGWSRLASLSGLGVLCRIE